MRGFLALARAETLILFRNPGYWLGNLIIAVLSIIVFGYLFKGMEDFPLGVADLDGSPTSQQVVAALESVPGIEAHSGSEQRELSALRKGDRWAVLVIPQGFGEGVSAQQARVQVYYNDRNLSAATDRLRSL